MLRKSIITLFLFVFFLPIICFSTQAFEPLEVVILPTYNTDKYFKDQETIDKMEYKLKRHFRYPYYELVTPENIKNAILALDPSLKNTNPCDQTFLKNVADKTCADIVVILHIKRAYSCTYSIGIFNPEDIQETSVELYCYIYSVKDNYYNNFKKVLNKKDFPTVHSGLDEVLPDLTDELIKKLPYKTIPGVK